jgi:hypothetical protein
MSEEQSSMKGTIANHKSMVAVNPAHDMDEEMKHSVTY